MGLPTPSLEAYPDNSFTAIASACCGQQIMHELLSRKVNRVVWQKVRCREFWKTCRKNWEDEDYVANLRLDKETFLFVVESLASYITELHCCR